MDYSQAFEMMRDGRLMRRKSWPGFRAAGLSDAMAVLDTQVKNICGLNESGVVSMIRLTEEDLKAQDWEMVLSEVLPDAGVHHGKEEDFQSQKNQAEV